MKHETYKGRKLKTVRGKTYGYVRAYVNSTDLGLYQGNEEYALQSMRGTIDYVDSEECEFGRYGIEWYAPGAAAQCDECTASKAVDGPCLSQWCMRLLHAIALAMNEEFDAKPAQVCVCPRMEPPAKFGHHVVCPLRATHTNREDTMNERRRTDGPPSGIQVKILDRLLLGERQKEMAADMGYSESYVSAELSLAVTKMEARTTTQACGFYATARAYREAADLLETGVQDENYGGDPDIPKVNEVLFGFAAILRERADKLLPS